MKQTRSNDFDVIVKVSYKIIGRDGDQDKAEKIKIDESTSTYMNALNRTRTNLQGLVEEFIDEINLQIASMCDVPGEGSEDNKDS